MFIIPEKEVTVRFITDFLKLKLQLVRKSYTFPRICETIQKLSVFHYTTPLNIGVLYYTIYLSTYSKDMKTIFTEFGPFR